MVQVNKEEIRSRFEAYKDEMLADLADLVSVDSAWSEPKENAPFGTGPAEALHMMLDKAEKMGFKTDNVDNYAGSAEYGEGTESVGILGHLDVVPAGTGWSSDPFKMDIRDGRVWGRGVIDDKGPVISALYAMRILRDMGVPLSRKIRLIFGTDEERGSGCMEYYTGHREIPTMGFTPDGTYPVTYAENGTLWNQLNFPAEDTPILSIEGGSAYNAVPDKVTVILDGARVSADELRRSIHPEDSLNCPVTVTEEPGGNVRMFVEGVTAPGSRPGEGINAAVSAANILCRFLGEKAGKMMHFLKDVIARDPGGEKLGIAAEYEESEPSTVNVGIIKYSPEDRHLCMDIRFPVNMRVADMLKRYDETIRKWGLSYTETNYSEPHYVPRDTPMVQTLLKVYRDVTGDQNAQPRTTGGGTYARHMGKNFVAFGACFPVREPENAHRADEHFVLDEFMRHCVIMTMAIYELAK